MAFKRERQGEFFIFSAAALWGLFPVVTIASYSILSPLASMAGSALFASVFFALVMSYRHAWKEIKNLSALTDALLTALFVVFMYAFIFIGLKYTGAGNASIIMLVEILFSYLFFHVWRKEHIYVSHIMGSVLMVGGAAILLLPNATGIRAGDFLVLAAAAVAPFANFFQRRAREKVGSNTIMFVRNSAVALGVFLFMRLYGPLLPSYAEWRSSLPLLAVNGIVLFGISKVLWIEGIYRITVTKANALSSVSPLFTLLFAWIFFLEPPTLLQIVSFLPLFFGVVLLTRRNGEEIGE